MHGCGRAKCAMPTVCAMGRKKARWIEGYERVAEMAANMTGTRLVYMADREADLVAIMRRARELDTPVDWLVRAKHNRCLPDGDGDKLWAHTSAGAALGGNHLHAGSTRQAKGAHGAPATVDSRG
jgi:hypothetical protein